MAASLVDSGAELQACADALFHFNSLAALRLKALMLAQMQLLFEAEAVVHLVDREMMLQSGAKEVDCEAALEESMGMPHVVLGVLLRENRDGTIKGSLRSVGDLDVEKIAQHFGGGGHHHAAGFNIKEGSLQSVYAVLLPMIKEEFR